MNGRNRLIRIIKHYLLDYRFPKWRETLFLIKQGIYDDAFCEILISEAENDAEEIEKQGLFLWRAPEEEELYGDRPPDIELGRAIETDVRIGILYKEGPKNVLIFGSAGSGKTVTCRDIIVGIDTQNQLCPDNPTILWVLDMKSDNQDLKQILKGDVILLSISDNLRIGLNGPPNVPPYIWIGQVSISLAVRLGLAVSRTCLAGIISLLLVVLNPGLTQSDLTDPTVTVHLTWPSLAMVLDALRIKKILDLYSTKAGYGQTLVQLLSGLLHDSGRLFDCSEGLDINKEVIGKNQHCVIAAYNIPSYIVHIVNDYFINYMSVSRFFENYKCDHTDVLFVYDEADLLLESDFENAFSDGMSPTNRLNRLGREIGLMSLTSVSSPQAASEHIRRSAYYSFGFNLADAHSVNAAVRHFQIDPRCSRLISSLRPGQCIFRQTQASWSDAIWCEMDLVPPARNIGKLHYPKQKFNPAVRLANAPHVIKDIKAVLEENDKTQRRLAAATSSDFEQLAIRLLKLAVENLYVPVARLMDRLGKIAPKTQIALRRHLEDREYAKFEEPRIGRADRLLIEVTEKGYSELGLPIPQGNKGRGSITHRHFARWIASFFAQQGNKAQIEWLVPGTNHPVDVAVHIEGKWHVIEICVTSDDNLVSHIKACFEQSKKVAKMTIVAGTQKDLKAIKRKLKAVGIYIKYGAQINFVPIEEYLGD